uniref:Uncharacterized protein n=1 Tax=Physcomitrium patens TaxID=3218 RepID=A0A2K1JG13_PHYPA|nr:hypothetical protein PHYPA_017841 [Physcomitrium patens]
MERGQCRKWGQDRRAWPLEVTVNPVLRCSLRQPPRISTVAGVCISQPFRNRITSWLCQ